MGWKEGFIETPTAPTLTGDDVKAMKQVEAIAEGQSDSPSIIRRTAEKASTHCARWLAPGTVCGNDSIDPHTCPHALALNQDARLCECCEVCTKQCADDI